MLITSGAILHVDNIPNFDIIKIMVLSHRGIFPKDIIRQAGTKRIATFYLPFQSTKPAKGIGYTAEFTLGCSFMSYWAAAWYDITPAPATCSPPSFACSAAIAYVVIEIE